MSVPSTTSSCSTALDVGQGGARVGEPVEGFGPNEPEPRGKRFNGVGVAGTGVIRAGPDDNAGGPAREEVADRRRGVDLLVRVVVVHLASLGVEHPEVAALRVAQAQRGAGAGGPAHDQLLLPGAIEISNRRRGKNAVSSKKRPARERRPVRSVEGVRLLVQ